VRRPRVAGHTDQGSPLFAFDGPIEFRLARNPPTDWELLIVVGTLDGEPASLQSRLTLACGDRSVDRPLRAWPWQRYPCGPAELLGDREDTLGPDPLLSIAFTGPHADRLALGELRLRHRPLRFDPVLLSNVQGISFVRSGHHMAAGFLERYFGPPFRYCDIDVHCRRRPCVDPFCSLQKGHDLDDDWPIEPDRDYLIQYRHPLEAIASWFTWRVKLKEWADGSEAGWRQFVEMALPIWQRFVRKWVIDFEHPRSLTLRYDEVMADPRAACVALVRFFGSGQPADENRVAELLQREPMCPRRRLEEFKYFDRGQFAALEARVRDEITQADLPLLLQ
jgi:hypothetical protein